MQSVDHSIQDHLKGPVGEVAVLQQMGLPGQVDDGKLRRHVDLERRPTDVLLVSTLEQLFAVDGSVPRSGRIMDVIMALEDE